MIGLLQENMNWCNIMYIGCDYYDKNTRDKFM